MIQALAPAVGMITGLEADIFAAVAKVPGAVEDCLAAELPDSVLKELVCCTAVAAAGAIVPAAGAMVPAVAVVVLAAGALVPAVAVMVPAAA